MKNKLFILLSACLGFFRLEAQDKIQIDVTSQGHPLAYAYVFANGNILGTVDSLGHLLVARSSLQTGDTLSASFVGARDAQVVYDSGAAAKSRLVIDLPANNMLDIVAVYSRDNSTKLFKKYVNVKNTAPSFTELRCQFRMELPDGRAIEGSYRHAMLPPYYQYRPGETQSSITTTSDTVGLSKVITNGARHMLVQARNAVALKKSYVFNEDFVIKYLGTHNEKRLFFITRPYYDVQTSLPFSSFQTLLYVDESTRDIISAEVSEVGNGDNLRLDFTADYVDEANQPVTRPSEVSGTYSLMHQGARMEIKIALSDVVLCKFGAKTQK